MQSAKISGSSSTPASVSDSRAIMRPVAVRLCGNAQIGGDIARADVLGQRPAHGVLNFRMRNVEGSLANSEHPLDGQRARAG